MTSSLPEWLGNVPLKTVGVLCATHIFGKNIESRQIVLAGKRYFHNAVENVVGYVLNPILPPLEPPDGAPSSLGGEATTALRNIRDCFNYIFHIQVEYFKILQRLRPEGFRSKSGVEFNLNQFMAKGPTLINSEKRYLILSRVDGAQPYDLRLNWNAEFDWVDDALRERFRDRLHLAQEAYAAILRMGEWYYGGRDKNLILPLKTIMDDLSEYFEHLGLAAYLMTRKLDRNSPETRELIRDNLIETCRHLERFCINMLRVNVFSIVKHDLDRLDAASIDAGVRARAVDESYVGRDGFDHRHREYATILGKLFHRIGYESEEFSFAGDAS
jgi:hypothetical protein